MIKQFWNRAVALFSSTSYLYGRVCSIHATKIEGLMALLSLIVFISHGFQLISRLCFSQRGRQRQHPTCTAMDSQGTHKLMVLMEWLWWAQYFFSLEVAFCFSIVRSCNKLLVQCVSCSVLLSSFDQCSAVDAETDLISFPDT